MSDTNETTLVICFGIFTLLATLAGLHYRDSLCCLFCRSLMAAWSRSMYYPGLSESVNSLCTDRDIDIEALAGTQHSSRRNLRAEDETFVELQPCPSIPLYFNTSLSEQSRT